MFGMQGEKCQDSDICKIDIPQGLMNMTHSTIHTLEENEVQVKGLVKYMNLTITYVMKIISMLP